MTTEFRRPMITTKIDDITTDTIKSSGGKIFANVSEDSNLQDITALVNSWRGIHAPTYGVAIPSSFESVTEVGGIGPTSLFTPLDNRTYIIVAASILNNGVGAGAADFGLLDKQTGIFVKMAAATPAAGASLAFGLRSTPPFNSRMLPTFEVTTGTPADFDCALIYAEIIQ